MKKEKTILLLLGVLIVVAISLMTGVGYAVEMDDTLIISDNSLLTTKQSDFKIEFTGQPTYTGNGVATLKITSPTTATMDITELNSVGDSITATFTISNKSNHIYADLYAEVTNTNTEYFKVTSLLSESTIQPKIGTSTIKLTVELIKLPQDKEERAAICTNIFANPVKSN